MLLLVLYSTMHLQRDVWRSPDPEIKAASFSVQRRSEIPWRSRLCDLLFDAPFEAGGPSFQIADSSENDIALDGIFLYKNGQVARNGQSFQSALKLLVNLEYDDVALPKLDHIPGAIGAIDRLLSLIPADMKRERLLCSEARWLLCGFVKPAAAAEALRALSKRSIEISPTASQVCLVHSIDLFKLINMGSLASKLFEAGKQQFSANNPTRYGRDYWKPRMQKVVRSTFDGKKFKTRTVTEYVSPHGHWRF